jgi:hypothetical protein
VVENAAPPVLVDPDAELGCGARFLRRWLQGQRIYVHPPTRTVIVQLADDSRQDFPFRHIAHYLAGQAYAFPRGIPGLLYTAALHGAPADSVRRLYQLLTADADRHPERYYILEAGMIQVGQALAAKRETRDAGVAVLELSVERSPLSSRSRAALKDVKSQ